MGNLEGQYLVPPGESFSKSAWDFFWGEWCDLMSAKEGGEIVATFFTGGGIFRTTQTLTSKRKMET